MHDNGDRVVYVGSDRDDATFGDRGLILSATAAYAHVQWTDGGVGMYDLADLDTVSPDLAITASLDDSLEVGTLVSLASAEEAYTESGCEGLVAHLAMNGLLSSYASLAEEALQLIEARLRLNPVIHQLVAGMDADEADQVVRKTAMVLLQDSEDF